MHNIFELKVLVAGRGLMYTDATKWFAPTFEEIVQELDRDVLGNGTPLERGVFKPCLSYRLSPI